MKECDFCDGPRINGSPLEVDPTEGTWRFAGPVNPAAEGVKFACRSCAKERIGTTAEG
ncbi:Zn finger [Haloarcula virus HCTV-15]|nr:Zn finger [Haloarcula virus HCTV-6]UBF22556.1 Zn finger [Haloarcula virus HCTV-15]